MTFGDGNEPDFRTRELSLRQSKLQRAERGSSLRNGYEKRIISLERFYPFRFAGTYRELILAIGKAGLSRRRPWIAL